MMEIDFILQSVFFGPFPRNSKHARNVQASHTRIGFCSFDSQISRSATDIENKHAWPNKIHDNIVYHPACMTGGKQIYAPIVAIRSTFKNFHEYV